MQEDSKVRDLKRKRNEQAKSDPWNNVPTIIAKVEEDVPMVTVVNESIWQT